MKKHRTPIQIRFKDVDALGHVNNANHLTYFETARVKYFDSLITEPIDWMKIGLIVASVTVNYKKPVFFKDDVYVDTSLAKIGRTSFELSYELIRKEKDGESILATGTSVLVCFDYEKQTPVEIPELWKKKMTE